MSKPIGSVDGFEWKDASDQNEPAHLDYGREALMHAVGEFDSVEVYGSLFQGELGVILAKLTPGIPADKFTAFPWITPIVHGTATLRLCVPRG